MIFESFAVFTFTLIAIAVLKRLAYQFNLVDRPNERSMHTAPIPRGAGIAIILPALAVLGTTHPAILTGYPYAVAGVLAVFILGVFDDVHSKSARVKFSVIILAIVLASFDGVCIDSLGVYFGNEVRLEWWIALPLTIFALAGFTNAFNLIDGLDGLSGSIGIVILSTLLTLGLLNNDLLLTTIPALLIAALWAFLYYNWHPASVFMGDSGALSLGFIISILFVHALTYINPAPILFMAALPVLDTIIVLVRRLRHGKPVHNADQTHMHHILLRHFNGDVSRTVIALILMQITFSALGFFMADHLEQIIILLLFGANLLLFYLIFSSMLNVQERMEELAKRSESETI